MTADASRYDGSGFRVQGSGLGVSEYGFRLSDSEFRSSNIPLSGFLLVGFLWLMGPVYHLCLVRAAFLLLPRGVVPLED